MHRPLLRGSLLLVTSSWWITACADDRVDVQASGPGSGVASSGPGPAGGAGGDGAGGDAPSAGGGDSGGAGGSGGASPGTGGEDPGAGGSGGDPYATCGVTADCVGDQPTPCPENACESSDLFEGCDGDDVPAAYVACVVWADVLRENVWATLVDCLRAASRDELCASASDVAERCWTEVTATTCLHPDAPATCGAAAELCGVDVETCSADLQPFSTTALDAYAACIAARAEDEACDDAHATCLADLTAP